MEQLPVVSRVGGLADTVIDASEAALNDGVATGFQFAPPTASALAWFLSRTFDLFARLPRGGRRASRMTREVGWQRPARALCQRLSRACCVLTEDGGWLPAIALPSFLREQLAPLGRPSQCGACSAKTGVFCDGLMFGMVTDNMLYSGLMTTTGGLRGSRVLSAAQLREEG